MAEPRVHAPRTVAYTRAGTYMSSMRFAWFCAFLAQGCFNPDSGSPAADTDSNTDSNGTESDSINTGSAVTSVTNSSMTSEPTTTNPTSITNPATTTDPETGSQSESDTEAESGSTGIEAQCGDGIPVATELCFDDDPVSHDVGPGAVDVGIGDISANGLLGIVVLHDQDGTGALTLLEPDGVGGYIEGDSQTAPSYAGRVRVTDIDADGDADILAVGGGGLRYYRNEAAFFLDYDAQTFQPGSSDVAEIIVADIDADDVPDVLASQAYAFTWYRGVMNAGNWAFAADFTELPIPGEGAAGMIAGAFSFDGDDDIDVVALNRYDSIVDVLINDGGGTFSTHSAPQLCAGDFNGIRFGDWADFDQDGNTDLVVTCIDGDLGVALDDGTGTFPTFTTLPLAGAYRPTVVDLDGDGAPDILVTSTTLMRAVLFRNDGNGSFALADTQFMGTGPVRGAAVADLNDDGALDVVVASGGENSHVDIHFATP